MCGLLRSFTLTLSFALFVTAAAPAQTKPADRYAAESYVIDRNDWVYSNNADGTGYRDATLSVTVQSEAAVRNFAVIVVPFASASEHVEFHYARVRHKDGSVTDTPVSGVIEQPEAVTQQAPFYSDLKQAQLPVKNLQVGDTLEWQARIVRTRAEAPNQFWGQDSFTTADSGVALEESIELRYPASSAVTVWTNPKAAMKPVESVDGATKVYRWTSSQLKPTAGPEAEAAKKAKKGTLLTADEETDAEEGKLPAMAWTTFPSWAAVGAWYRGLEGTRTDPDDEVKAKVAELTAGKTTEEDKVRAVYGYVSTQIHYIGVAFGVGRFQPHEAVDVLHNQYGDCKDKATLLASMLRVLGLQPDTVLIGAEVRMNEAVPSPAAFNHAITRVKVGEEEVWLDSTSEVAPYKVLLFAIRDKEALVVPMKGTASLQRTPASLPFPSVDAWKAVGALDKDGVSESHIVLTLRGDDEVVFRSAARQVAPANWDDLVQKIVASMGYGGTVSHASFSRPEDTSQPFTMDFDYHREKAGDWDNLRTIPQLMIVQMPTVDEKNPPTGTTMIGVPHTELSHAEMKLPAGWTAELPEAVHASSKWATYDMTFRFENGTIYTDRKLVILERKVPASEWKAYKTFTDAISPGVEPYIQLRRGYTDTPSTLAAPVTANETVVNSSDSVETLLAKAENAGRNSDIDGAKKYLDAVEAKDPKASRLWLMRAILAEELGAPNQALEDCRKELANHPDEVDVFPVMAGAQAMQRDTAMSIETLKTWATKDPENPKPQELLESVYFADKNWTGAAEAGEKALGMLSQSDDIDALTHLKLQTGEAELKAGQTEKGEAKLLALVQASSDSGILNDAAYALADAKLDLPEDEAAERAVLAKMDTETQAWTLDESPGLLGEKTSLLVASWDTMGWILFREGKAVEAKTYIEAAARNENHAEVKEHLEAVNAALHVKEKVPPHGDEHKAEQEARTFVLGPANGLESVAEYRMLVAAGRVERVEAQGGKTIHGAEEMLKKADLSTFFPAGSTAKLVKHGMLNCHVTTCDLVVER